MFKQKANVLYVDDEYYNLNAFNAAFRKYYNIFTSTSARGGIEILENQPIHLIITDQRMPEMTGVQFLSELMQKYPEPVRMILTGFTDVEAIKEAINHGYVLRYITKPWNETELRQIIDMGIKIHDLEQNQRLLIKKLETGLEQEKKAIEMFKQYVREDVLNQILKADKDQLAASGGEKCIISTLISNIQDFSQFYKTLDARDTLSYINQYFNVMINCLTKHHGSVYKFMGDKLVATFSTTDNHQLNAVQCALDMIDELKDFNQTIGRKFNHETIIGIGISTGSAILGQIISKQGLNYIAVGKPFNTAMKIEEQTHTMTNGILIDEPTYNAVKNDIQTESFSSKDANKLYKVVAIKSKT